MSPYPVGTFVRVALPTTLCDYAGRTGIVLRSETQWTDVEWTSTQTVERVRTWILQAEQEAVA